MRARRRTAAAGLALVLAAVLTPAHTAQAGGIGWGSGGGNGGDTINSQVQITTNGPSGTQTFSTNIASWSPPTCWFEPRFTPDQYKTYWETVLIPAAGSFAQYVLPQYEALKAINFNIGKPGLWWGLAFADKAWTLPGYDQCFQKPGEIWVPTNTTPVGVPAVSPTLLSKVAWAATRLPGVSVTLSPPASKQVVNFATDAVLSAPLGEVSVTAHLNTLGVNVAASTLAVPVSLQLNAGTTTWASPSTCTYPLVRSGSSYVVSPSAATRCRIMYLHSGSYQLTGQIVWHVTWSATTNPHGPVAGTLPNGISGAVPIPVTVTEVQTIVVGGH